MADAPWSDSLVSESADPWAGLDESGAEGRVEDSQRSDDVPVAAPENYELITKCLR